MRHRRVLITGGNGFLGRHVAAELCAGGYDHVLTPRRSQYDLTQMEQVDRMLADCRPDVVIHLAAQVGGIGANRLFPGSFLYANLIMGAQLIEACRRRSLEKFVNIGTICAYPKHTPVPFKETDLWNGFPEETNAPYGLAKKLLTVQLQAYRQQYGFPGVNLLLVNLYGPGDNFDPTTSHVIPALIRKCFEAHERCDQEVVIWGTGTPTREFLYVADAARAIRLALERLDTPEPVNVGSGEEISIHDLARLVARKTGFRGNFRFDASFPDGQPRRCLDITRSREWLGFQPSVPLDAGLDRTIEWFRQVRSTNQVA